MKRPIIIVLVALLGFNVSCRKDKEVKCELKEYPFYPFIEEYNFKQGSSWAYKLKDSMRVASMNLEVNYASSIPATSNPRSNNTVCDSFTRYPYSELMFKHSLQQNHNTEFGYNIGDGFICFNRLKYRNYGTAVFAWLHDPFDTLRYSSEYPVNKVYQEKLWDNISILDKNYQNVRQVYYYPSYSGFRRVWWCPNVGFVKMEYLNSTTGAIETWELQSYNAAF